MNEILSGPQKYSAEQREKEISEMKNAVLGFAIKHKTSMDPELAVRALHEAGYRKVEGGDRQGEALQVAVRALERLESEPGCGCSPPCQCSGPEWSRAEIEGRMGEAEEALRKIEKIQGGAA